MALPIENRQIAYYTSCALTTLITYGIFCNARVLNSLHFLNGASAGFLRTLAASRPPRYATIRGPYSTTSGTRIFSTRSAPARQVQGLLGGADDDGAGSIAPHGKLLPFEEDDAPYRRDH